MDTEITLLGVFARVTTESCKGFLIYCMFLNEPRGNIYKL